MTTDTSKTARQIINTYELRPEIEEDFRQMKDFWKLEDFKSTKYNYITYLIVQVNKNFCAVQYVDTWLDIQFFHQMFLYIRCSRNVIPQLDR